MTANYVEIIGYQLEKIHSGLVSYLLDTHYEYIPMKDKVTILNRFLNNKNLDPDKISSINTRREYSFGRGLRIDLVIEVLQIVDPALYLIMEFKTDSDVNLDQLKKMKMSFQNQNPNSRCSYFIVTLGAGQFTYQHMRDKIDNLEFEILNTSSFIDIFSNLSISGTHYILDTWYDSLKKESERNSMIDKDLMKAKDPWDNVLSEKGYRVGFPVFYLYYAKLREVIEKSSFNNWAIYSGSNNPVLNWQEGKIQKSFKDDHISLYWEFNWNAFCLKAHLKPEQLEYWRNLKSEIEPICLKTDIRGRKSRFRKGEWVTIFKWEFDFCKQSVREISKQTIRVLKDLHNELKEASF